MIFFMVVCNGVAADEIVLINRGFEIKGPRLAVTIQDGVIIGLVNRKTGEIHGDVLKNDLHIPRGLGQMAGNAADMVSLHNQWGARQLNVNGLVGSVNPSLHFPHVDSKFSTVRTPDGISATWLGLTNGVLFFPNEQISIKASIDPKNGQVLLWASGQSDTFGVYGIQVPLANLDGDHLIYVPSFGGVFYDQSSVPGLVTLGGAPFWEAPVVALEGKKGSIGLWIQDQEFRPNFFFMNWSGNSFSVAIEHLNYMPFDTLKSTESATWRLDAFDGGWIDAMTPYKNWYAENFSKEIDARSALAWPKKIRIIIDQFKISLETYTRIATLFNPKSILIHEWNPRASAFDHDLPDWTPRAGYIESVSLAHQFGFKTMGYVNTYCINFDSPFFRKDHISDFGLTKKFSGISGYLAPKEDFKNAKPGQIMYLDALSAEWRKYHIDMMAKWNKLTGTDANYEDVGGTAADFGNGRVDGLIGAQGGSEQFRGLLEANPGIAMGSEFAPDHMAFASWWPLRYQQIWGSNKVRNWWMSNQRPVSCFIHGSSRPWVPVLNAGTEFLRHVVVGCSDALGGIAQVPGDYNELDATTGMTGHMIERAQLFSRAELEPVFNPGRKEKDLACVYKDASGQMYNYFTTPTVQEMDGPDYKPVYQRIIGLSEFKTSLVLPGWPASNEAGVFGLNPLSDYAFTRSKKIPLKLTVKSLPKDLMITRFESNAHRTVLVIQPTRESSPKKGSVVIQSQTAFIQASLNGSSVEVPKFVAGQGVETRYETNFPAYFVFIESTPEKPQFQTPWGDHYEPSRFISMNSGIERGGTYQPPKRAEWSLAGYIEQPVFFFLNGGSDSEVTLDYLVVVPDKTSSIEILFRNTQEKLGNGTVARVYIDGQLVYEKTLTKNQNTNWQEGMDSSNKFSLDTDCYKVKIPVGHLAGRPIAVTLATDSMGDNNCDELWWSRPFFIREGNQKQSVEHLNSKENVWRLTGTRLQSHPL